MIGRSKPKIHHLCFCPNDYDYAYGFLLKEYGNNLYLDTADIMRNVRAEQFVTKGVDIIVNGVIRFPFIECGWTGQHVMVLEPLSHQVLANAMSNRRVLTLIQRNPPPPNQ